MLAESGVENMNAGLWVWLGNRRWGGWGPRFARLGRGGMSLLEISTPDTEQLLRRIAKMERDIFLPVKVAAIVMLLYSFYRVAWIRTQLDSLSIAVEWTRYFLWYYIPVNVLIAGVLLAMRRLPVGLVQWTVFFSGLMDAVFLSALTVLTSGYSSFLYWLFLALIIRSAVSVPRATSQLALHATIIFCYVIAGVIQIAIANSVDEQLFQPGSVTQPVKASKPPVRQDGSSEERSSMSSRLPSATGLPPAPDSNASRQRPYPAGTNTAQDHEARSREAGEELSRHQPEAAPAPVAVPAAGSNASRNVGDRARTAREAENPSGARRETNVHPLLRPNGWANLTVARVPDESAAETTRQTGPLEPQAEPFLVRLTLLILMSVCSYGVQVLFERQRKAEEEAREFAMREGQLHAAGRLAAEFTHQMKNPLAIINTASYSLQRALKAGRTDVSEQIQIIQEEVEHSDRIITEIMGYAQLSEGRVEKLDVIEELNAAIERVFPPAAGYPVTVRRDYAGQFPPLLMLRRHVSETFINLLQNAREALGNQGGEVRARARCQSDYSIEVSISDNGPGIPPDKRERVFEAYYTTKEKGTGLGLATVKHNVELYGGKVRVESELGKGACFHLVFPAKTLLKLETQT